MKLFVFPLCNLVATVILLTYDWRAIGSGLARNGVVLILALLVYLTFRIHSQTAAAVGPERRASERNLAIASLMGFVAIVAIDAAVKGRV